jgi:hypothetical protein
LLPLAEECIGANIAARQQELRLELLLLEAPLLGQRIPGDLPRPTRPARQQQQQQVDLTNAAIAASRVGS